MRRTVPALALFLAFALPAAAAGAWLHVRVVDGDGGETVKLNLPLALAQAAVDTVGEQKLKDQISQAIDEAVGPEIKLPQLRTLWAELKKAGDAEFLSIEGRDGNVRVAREADLVVVRVVGKEDEDETVKVELPVRLVDALLGTEGDQIDLRAAMDVLAGGTLGDLVRVDGGGSNVRIWVE